MERSELQGELRNDGRSIHHRNEIEKAFASIAVKIEELKSESGNQEARNFQIGGS